MKLSEMDIRRCYDVLEVSLGASGEDIKRHYKDLVNIWHPDRFYGNPRLQKKAERKLSEINIAYEALINFLQSDAARNLGTGQMGTGPRASGSRSPGFGGRGSMDGGRQPDREYAAAKPRSGFFRLFLILAVISLAGLSYVMLPKLKVLKQFIDQPANFMGETVENAIREMSAKTPIPGVPPPTVPETTGEPAVKPPPRVKKYFEICLKNGSCISAQSYKVSNNMLVYKVASGTIGIQKSSVRSITSREIVVE